MKRRTVSLSDEALEAINRIAKENRTTVSGVVEAAGLMLADGGAGADSLTRRLVARGDGRRGKVRKKAKKAAGQLHLSGSDYDGA